MLQPLKHLLTTFLALEPAKSAADAAQALHLATAVLLVEVMRADHEHSAEEHQAVIKALGERFALPPDAMDDLIALAQDTARTANDFHAFTSQVNERFTHPQKIELVESLWHVAYADAHLDAHENHVISKVAGLLHVTHGEYIAAKMRAKAAALPSN
ncbi:TerB family tellurite resistance protein [Hydrogenophaga sp.]|uniref:tellurite resistance TerB family protein n=1 Tax=Hydrogenophaga sp. TaxID=1904254 RepID=UPI0035B14539